MERRCTECKQVKPITEFDTSGPGGRKSYCKACRRVIRRAAYVPHPQPRVSVEEGQRFGRLTVLEETAPRNNSRDRKSTRLNSSHPSISYAVFCLKKKKT